MVFADPHWGNFIVDPSGTRLGVVDFGSIHHVDPHNEMTMVEVLAAIDHATSLESFVSWMHKSRLREVCRDNVGEILFPTYSLFRRLLFVDHHYNEQTRIDMKETLDNQDTDNLPDFQGTVPVTRMLYLTLSMLTYMDVTINVRDFMWCSE